MHRRPNYNQHDERSLDNVRCMLDTLHIYILMKSIPVIETTCDMYRIVPPE